MGRTRLLLFYTVLFLSLSVDQLAKHAVTVLMPLDRTIPLVNGVFHLTFITNTGAAFGLLKGWNFIFLIVSAVFIGAINVYMLYKKPSGAIFQTALGLVCGGAAGNLIDRIFRGHVIDFFDVRFFSIFNTADVMINLGVALLVLEMLFREKRRERHCEE